MRLALLGMSMAMAAGCAKPGIVAPATSICPSSGPVVELARMALANTLQRGGFGSEPPGSSVADSLLGFMPSAKSAGLAPAGTKPELITDRAECEGVAYEVLHTPRGAQNVVAFRYGTGFIVVYGRGTNMGSMDLLDAQRQTISGIISLDLDDDR